MAEVTRVLLPRRGRRITMEAEIKKDTILAEGELFVECCDDGIGKGYGRLKMGDGVTTYENLPYLLGDSGNMPVKLNNTETTLDAALVAINTSINEVSNSLNSAVSDINKSIEKVNTSMSAQKYAGSESVNGPANSAVKLESAVNIGSASFDGSSDVTLEDMGVAAITHGHSASEITSGTIDIARLPAGSLERVVVVANDTARFALTTNDIQVGDTVKVVDTGYMYFVVNASKLSSADGYVSYSTAAEVIAGELDFGSED